MATGRSPGSSTTFVTKNFGYSMWRGFSTFTHFAIALQLGFHCLLRTGELLQVQAKDITVSGEYVHLYLGQTKTSFRNANVDAVHIQHRHLALLVRTWKSSVHKDSYLLSMSSTAFRSMFSKALEESVELFFQALFPTSWWRHPAFLCLSKLFRQFFAQKPSWSQSL